MSIIVYFPEEMLNDAKGYLQKAERFHVAGEERIFQLWREVRGTVIFAIAALESLMNSVAHDYVREHPDLNSVIKDYLCEEHTWPEHGELKSRRRFISLNEKLIGWTKVITGNTFDKRDIKWQRFQEVKDFRDEIMHYKVTTKPTIYKKGRVEMARQAVESVQDMIERFYAAWGKPLPEWVRAPYREIT